MLVVMKGSYLSDVLYKCRIPPVYNTDTIYHLLVKIIYSTSVKEVLHP